MTPSSPPVALRASMLGVSVGTRSLLRDASLSLTQGQWLGVCGPNGAGKSTLLRALAGLQAFTGQVELMGRPLGLWPALERATQLTWMGQAQPVPLDLTVGDVVQLGRWTLAQWKPNAVRSDCSSVREVIEIMGLAAVAHRGLEQVSGGECQRALLARAMATATPVMLFDEPLNHLDLPHQQAWLTWLRRQVASGSAVVTVMHELNQALGADRLLVMRDGRVLHQGSPADATTHEALQEAFDHTLSFHAIDTEGTGPRWVVLPRRIS